jgi:hypothetical protein
MYKLTKLWAADYSGEMGHNRKGRRAHGRRAVAAAVAVGAVLGATTVPAMASTSTTGKLPKALKIFSHCPISDSAVTLCLVGSMTGSFTVGSQTLTTPSPATLTLGLAGATAVAPTDGTPVLQSPAIPVSILGIPPLPGVLSVTAVPQLTALPTVSLTNLLTEQGTAVGLSLDVQVNNALLGSSCTIGSSSDPINVNLTSGTTNPPPPNQPITGTRGTTTTNTKTGETTNTGTLLVDNAFAVPGTSGCGLFGVLDPILNLIEGLPSAAGNNAASFSGTTYLVPASILRKDLG